MLKIESLSKRYGMADVLNITALSINLGECVGLVGNNGAGKTTFLSLCLDLIEASTGEVNFEGLTVKGNIAGKMQTGAYLDEGFLPTFLTPMEYFELVAQLKGVPSGSLDDFLDKFRDFFNGEILGGKKYIRALSKGNLKKVGIAGAMIGEPKLLLLDEPFANLDPSSQYQLVELIHQYRKNHHAALVVSSHDLDQVTAISSRIVVLEKGQVVKDVSKNEHTLSELREHFKTSLQN